MNKLNLVNSGTVFLATLVVIPVVISLVYVSGMCNHRSFYLNSLISSTILSIVFLTFITTGLYKGWKLKDTLGNFPKKISFGKLPDTSLSDFEVTDIPGNDDGGILGMVVSVVIWLLMALIYSLLFWIVGGLIWATLLLVAGLLYWIVFRAFRLIFKHSRTCQGNIGKSFFIATFYTVLYNFWIYLVVMGTYVWPD